MVELNPKLARIKRPLTDENKENRTPVFCPSDPNHRSATVNHALTLPRINANPERETSVQTPCFIPSSTPRQQSKSEPCAKPLQNITNIIKKQSSDRFAKDTTACEDEEALKTKALWEHQDAQHMARHLNLQLEKSVIKACSTPILLFRWLEQNSIF